MNEIAKMWKSLGDKLDIAALFKEMEGDEQFGGCFSAFRFVPIGCFEAIDEKPYEESRADGVGTAILRPDASGKI